MSLGNPMFIDRPLRPQRTRDEADSSHDGNNASGSADFLTNHGGKIALGGFSFAAALVYRWFIGGRNRTLLEEQITEQSPLHPYESNDLRIMNSMTCRQFSVFEDNCREKFTDGLSTYDEVVRFYREQDYSISVREGHVIDRIVLNFVEKKSLSSPEKFIEGQERLPVSFFLVALSNVVNAPPDDRIAMLFDVAKNLSAAEVKSFHAPDTTDGSSFDDEVETSGELVDGLYCKLENVVALVSFLLDANQIPYEKMIKESGVYIPFKQFRKTTALEMVKQGIDNLKPPPHKIAQLSVDEFTELLASSSVCVWGECYRKN